jgi:hypothetical protein
VLNVSCRNNSDGIGYLGLSQSGGKVVIIDNKLTPSMVFRQSVVLTHTHSVETKKVT